MASYWGWYKLAFGISIFVLKLRGHTQHPSDVSRILNLSVLHKARSTITYSIVDPIIHWTWFSYLHFITHRNKTNSRRLSSARLPVCNPFMTIRNPVTFVYAIITNVTKCSFFAQSTTGICYERFLWNISLMKFLSNMLNWVDSSSNVLSSVLVSSIQLDSKTSNLFSRMSKVLHKSIKWGRVVLVFCL